MIRKTTFAVAAGALAAAAALASCTPMKMGAAALVGDDRITTADLDQTVQDWRKEFDRDPNAGRIQEDPRMVPPDQRRGVPFDYESPQRSALYELLDFRIWQRVARDQGIDVSRGQIDQTLNATGAPDRVRSTVLAHCVPVSYTRDFVRNELVQRAVLERAGVSTTETQRPDPAGQQEQLARRQQALQRLVTVYVNAAKSMKITVNPRFGSLKIGDPSTGQPVTLAPVTYKLSGTESGTG